MRNEPVFKESKKYKFKKYKLLGGHIGRKGLKILTLTVHRRKSRETVSNRLDKSE